MIKSSLLLAAEDVSRRGSRWCGDFVRHDVITFIHLVSVDVNLIDYDR